MFTLEMKLEALFILSFIIAVALTKRLFKRVINGEDAPGDKYQWAISLKGDNHEERSVTVCGATLIHRQWLLSAAHCFYTTDGSANVFNQTDPSIWHVRAGAKSIQTFYSKNEDENERIANEDWHENIENREDEWDELLRNLGMDDEIKVKRSPKEVTTGHIHLHVEKIILHPKYKGEEIEWDIALLKLRAPIKQKYLDKFVKIIELPKKSYSKKWPKKGQKCVLVGWGCAVSQGDIVEYGQLATLQILTNRYCEEVYDQGADLNWKHEFCAGSTKDGHAVCEGDSGSGLACVKDSKWIIAGVASATHAENPERFPGIFTRVSHFVPWIKRVIRNH